MMLLLLCIMTILTPNSSHILQTNDHANMEARYRKAGVVANDGETNSGVTLESAPPGASPGGWCGVGSGYSLVLQKVHPKVRNHGEGPY